MSNLIQESRLLGLNTRVLNMFPGETKVIPKYVLVTYIISATPLSGIRHIGKLSVSVIKKVFFMQ